MWYEIDDADGGCLYRGTDLELACEIHDLDAAAHLLVLPPSAVGLPAQRRRAAAEDERTGAVR
jgi:hypothetical protein